jgi:hypothetical protein
MISPLFLLSEIEENLSKIKHNEIKIIYHEKVSIIRSLIVLLWFHRKGV